MDTTKCAPPSAHDVRELVQSGLVQCLLLYGKANSRVVCRLWVHFGSPRAVFVRIRGWVYVVGGPVHPVVSAEVVEGRGGGRGGMTWVKPLGLENMIIPHSKIGGFCNLETELHRHGGLEPWIFYKPGIFIILFLTLTWWNNHHQASMARCQ